MSARRTSRSSAAWLAEVRQRLEANRRLDRPLDDGGRLHVERQLPFLVVHRRPADRPDPGTDQLVRSTASWLVASGERRGHRRLKSVVGTWAEVMGEAFGATLVLEIWSGPALAPGEDEATLDADTPAFQILAPRRGPSDRSLRVLAEALGELRVRRRRAAVQLVYAGRRRPPGLPGLMTAAEARERRCTVVGLEVRPVHADEATGEAFPLVTRTLARRLGRALHKAFFAFAHDQTTHRPLHYHELGRSVLSRAAREVDGRLAAVAGSFDFLLACTPVNTDEAWAAFRRGRYRSAPSLHYRPLRVDPARAKRELFAVPLERVQDPALARLFRGKQDELDRQLTLLRDRQTERFLPGSIALYGRVGSELLALARQVLRRIPASAKERGRASVDAAAFAAAAEAELQAYRRQWPGLRSSVSVRDDLPGGLMVSHGQLLVGRGLKVPAHRVDALIQHEVGTHVVTFANGGAQPFQQLSLGLDGYDALQEGLAVLAEHLVGGLTAARLRLLAARVLAADSVERGRGLVATFERLADQGFEPRTAFGVAVRVHRAGGLTKDAVYLRGLAEALLLVGSGSDLDDLFVGKLAADHLGTVRELCRRRVLRTPPLTPRYLSRPEVGERLAAVRAGLSVLDLAREAS